MRFLLSVRISFDPLEQFDIFALLRWLPTITNLLLFFLVSWALVGFSGYGFSAQLRSPFARLFNSLFAVVSNLVQTSLLRDDRRHLPLFFYLFIFIFLSNLIGILPYGYTTTSSVFTGLFLSGTIFGGVFLVSVLEQGLVFFGRFLPSGAPLRMLKFLVVIEVISYVIRAFSLAIRLVANMISGHALLKILVGFLWTVLASLGAATLFLPAPWLLILAVTGLEVLVAGLQAYVFTFLACIYLSEASASAAH